jgi:hypothetical protein
MPPDYIGKQKWLQKVTNPNTGTYYRISDLPIEWRRNKEDKPYPIKQANQIIRVKTAVGREWLKSKQQYAIDKQGNEIMESFSDLEQWDKPVSVWCETCIQKESKRSKEYGVTGVKDFKKHFDLPFNQQNLKEALYKLRLVEEPASVSLIISKLGYDGNPLGHPYQIENYEDFANRPFDELYDSQIQVG